MCKLAAVDVCPICTDRTEPRKRKVQARKLEVRMDADSDENDETPIQNATKTSSLREI
jgi:hypothetical protein